MLRLIPCFSVALVLVLVGSGCGSKTPPTHASLEDTWKCPTDEMVMVYVPAGEFEMGSTELGEEAKPVHEVALDGFWIDRTEVTNAQYQRCVQAGECDPPEGETRLGGVEYYGQSATTTIRLATLIGPRRRSTASGSGDGCRRRRSGSTRPEGRRASHTRGAIMNPTARC